MSSAHLPQMLWVPSCWPGRASSGGCRCRESSRQYAELQDRFGSLSRLQRLVSVAIDRETFADTRNQRREDILTYIAMLRLRGLKPPPIRRLSDETQADLKSLWPSYKGALEEANTFLFRMAGRNWFATSARGRPWASCFRKICNVHKSVEDRLPPLLRLILFAAGQIVGDVDYDLVKMATDGRKVSFLRYPGFGETGSSGA